MACFLFSVSSLIRSSATWLFDGGVSDGRSIVSNPKRIWFGDRPVVSFFRLLCTAEARASQCVQSSGAADVIRQRYCSTHWFFHSEMPSVWVLRPVSRSVDRLVLCTAK